MSVFFLFLEAHFLKMSKCKTSCHPNAISFFDLCRNLERTELLTSEGILFPYFTSHLPTVTQSEVKSLIQADLCGVCVFK